MTLHLPDVQLCTPKPGKSYPDGWFLPSVEDYGRAHALRQAGIVALSHSVFRRPVEQITGDVRSNSDVRRVARGLRQVIRRANEAGIRIVAAAAPQIGESAA